MNPGGGITGSRPGEIAGPRTFPFACQAVPFDSRKTVGVPFIEGRQSAGSGALGILWLLAESVARFLKKQSQRSTVSDRRLTDATLSANIAVKIRLTNVVEKEHQSWLT